MPRLDAARSFTPVALALVTACAGAPDRLEAQESVARILPVQGLTLVSTFRHAEGERDDAVELVRVDSAGIHYLWQLVEIRNDGDTVVDRRQRRVRASDLLGAPRLDPVFADGDPLERPGFTAFSISSAAYVTLRDVGRMRFTMTRVDTASGAFASFGRSARRAIYKGTLMRASPEPGPFPLLVDGRRVRVPALHLRGDLANGPRTFVVDLWVLADSAHPLLLKAETDGNVFQMIRVDHPAVTDGLAAQLATACRAELPGIYFGFNSSVIDPASDRALEQLAGLLGRHPDWRITVEGHTDSIGTASANRALSQRRAEAVRARLAGKHGVDTRTWNAVGYGPERPRESNATVEGRARNRRVELARDCSERS